MKANWCAWLGLYKRVPYISRKISTTGSAENMKYAKHGNYVVFSNSL